MNVVTDPFFWFTLIFGLILLIQLVAVAIFAGPAYRMYRGLKRVQYPGALREKLGPVR